jgi:hypothetical protein
MNVSSGYDGRSNPGSRDNAVSTAQLNSSQKLHLRVSLQYMDQLLQDVESVLHSAKSRFPFLGIEESSQINPAELVDDIQILRSGESEPPAGAYEVMKGA